MRILIFMISAGWILSAQSGPTKITFAGGQLKIEATGTTLADVLTKVASLTGVTIDIPEGARAERLYSVSLGPGPAREVLSELLADTNFDYLIQSGDSNPGTIQSLVLLAKDKKPAGNPATEIAARPNRSPYARPAVPQEPPAETPPPAPEATVAAAPADATQPPPPTAAAAEPPPTDPRISANRPFFSNGTDTLNGQRIGPQSVPSSLTQESINTQLQQMYQQRIQINQQEKQIPATPKPDGQ